MYKRQSLESCTDCCSFLVDTSCVLGSLLRLDNRLDERGPTGTAGAAGIIVLHTGAGVALLMSADHFWFSKKIRVRYFASGTSWLQSIQSSKAVLFTERKNTQRALSRIVLKGNPQIGLGLEGPVCSECTPSEMFEKGKARMVEKPSWGVISRVYATFGVLYPCHIWLPMSWLLRLLAQHFCSSQAENGIFLQSSCFNTVVADMAYEAVWFTHS